MKRHGIWGTGKVVLESELTHLAFGDRKNVEFTPEEFTRLEQWKAFMDFRAARGDFDEDNVMAPPLVKVKPPVVELDSDEGPTDEYLSGRDTGDEHAHME